MRNWESLPALQLSTAILKPRLFGEIALPGEDIQGGLEYMMDLSSEQSFRKVM